MAQSGCAVLFFGAGGEEWVRGWCTRNFHMLCPTGGCYLAGEHGVLRNVKSHDLRANNVRPYGYARADGVQTVRRGRTPGDPLLPFGQFTLCRACV